MKEDKNLILPLPTIRRYPIYLRAIHAMIAGGELHISSAVLADKLSLDPVLTRKDLAMAGVPGRPRRGYPAKELADALNRALGWDNATDALLVGVGSLGKALLGYSGFEEQNLSIAVAFDADAGLLGQTFHGVKVRAMEDLQKKLTHSIESVTGLHIKVKLVAPQLIQRSEGKAKRVFDRRQR